MSEPIITRHQINNPLARKTKRTELFRIAAEVHKERDNWLDATMKKYMPGWVYRAVWSGFRELEKGKGSDRVETCVRQNFAKAHQFMEQEGWEIRHHELITSLWKRGVEVERFELTIHEGA